jgi:GNAT superfamily N-acetyltransferase
MKNVDVVRTYLELRSPEQLRPDGSQPEGVSIVREAPCSIALYRRLYSEVGGAYAWTDRLAWSDETLAAHLARIDVEVWTVRVGESLAGFVELKGNEDGAVEIVYFGLLPAFHRRGLGKWFLTRAVDLAWAFGANRVWLHTCTLDDPAALPNYRARGFAPFRTEQFVVRLAD